MEPRYIFNDDYMADPSAHVFEGKLYIYPSHDIDAHSSENDNGDHFMMRDYHALRLDDVEHGQAVDLGKVLDLDDIPWASKQLWAPDCVEKDGKYYALSGTKGWRWMEADMVEEFNKISNTLFVPIKGRIYSTENFPNILNDEEALKLKGKLPPDKGTFSQYTLLASAVRSRNMDRYINNFLKNNPAGVIIEIGCGLETTYFRHKNNYNDNTSNQSAHQERQVNQQYTKQKEQQAQHKTQQTQQKAQQKATEISEDLSFEPIVFPAFLSRENRICSLKTLWSGWGTRNTRNVLPPTGGVASAEKGDFEEYIRYLHSFMAGNTA